MPCTLRKAFCMYVSRRPSTISATRILSPARPLCCHGVCSLLLEIDFTTKFVVRSPWPSIFPPLRQSLNSYSVPVLPSTLNNPEQPLPSPFSVNLLPSNPRRSTWERGRQHTTGVKNNGLGLVTVGSGFKFMANSGWEGYLQNENGIHHQATCGVTGNMKLYEDVSS